jgi:hypothetical protein
MNTEQNQQETTRAVSRLDAVLNMVARNEYGKPVKRTKRSHPYNYDGFVLWRGGANEEANDTIYSDRLLDWDSAKHDELCQKHFGNRAQRWSDRKPEEIEAFLRDFMDKPNLRLIFVMEYCNQATGYPVWRFDCAV